MDYRGTTDRLQINSAAAAIAAGELVAVGDSMGIAADDAAIGEPVTLWTRTDDYTPHVVGGAGGEAIAAGAEIYWNPIANVLSRRATDAPAGLCTIAKGATDTGMQVALLNPHRKHGVVRVAFDFAHAAFAAFGAIGAVTLRTLGAAAWATRCRVYADANLADTTATVAVGTTGALTSLQAATAASILVTNEVTDSGAINVAITDVIVTIGVAALTAGVMVVEVEYGDAA